MSLKLDANTSLTAHHINDGPIVFPYATDAHSAVSRFPNEWSLTPWEKDGKRAVAVVEIPLGWENGTARERIDLAMTLGAPRKGLTAAHADEVITAEVERRAEMPAPEPELGRDDRRAKRTNETDFEFDRRIAAERQPQDGQRTDYDRPRVDETAARAEADRRAEVDRRVR